MNLKELKKMIAEEYNLFSKSRRKNFKARFANKIKLKEQAGPGLPPGAPQGAIPPSQGGLPKINVSDVDVDVEGGGDAEATLQKLFDMLKDYFENDAEAPADDTADDTDAADADDADDADDKDDDEDDEDKDALNEGGCFNKRGKRLKESRCYDRKGNLKEGYRRTKKAELLQERFKKLANIIK